MSRPAGGAGTRGHAAYDALVFDVPHKAYLEARPKLLGMLKDGGVFGALRDAAPDAWGRRVVERRLGSSNREDATCQIAGTICGKTRCICLPNAGP